ncbi:392_t:CDS:2 [Ambispora gerdemannii]|uniref:392_t:CDS:1 n=1 Tax=Ambispora gerdemannii TaxID=144530 RepID=A0A9N8VAR6_9GLOM|nr:392_t:CDS:2 [Ambispora gerdemannii]
MEDYARKESEFQAGIPPRLVSIFYAVFHEKQGPKVIYEVPEGSILPTSESTKQPILDFNSISEYIIPKDSLAGHLVTVCTDSHKVLGFPVYIDAHKYKKVYKRNNFIFNLCFVFDRNADTSSYEPVVRKIARVLTSLELESGFLYEKKMMYNVIEQLLEDLNSYCECQIPINSANTINLKLFPTYPNPPPVYDYQVPICTVNLEVLMDVNWDLTMKNVATRINGIHHVKKIADLADVDPGLARKCMEHLLYYGCIIMVDIFQFSNVYAVKPDIMRVLEDEAVQNECISYVTKLDAGPPPSFIKLFSLYCQLKYGVSLKEWIEENQVSSLNIDIRRFITFGVIKRFLYRVHKYPVLPEFALLSNGGGDSSNTSKLPLNLRKLLNGTHHYDEICTAENCSAKELDEKLSVEPKIWFIWR